MENTENLQLPYIMPSQAQKHVTHNEAIRQLDALVQLSVVSMALSEPPDTPVAGSRYIVGENATAAWAGLEGKIAAFLDGAWSAFEPRVGWLAYVEDQNTIVVRSTETWQDFSLPKSLQNMEGVGIGASSDSTNKLSVGADASLFSHDGNSHRMKINKADEGQSATMIFQSNWIGHAEFGLAGNNNFQVKVSDDGANFQTAMQIDKASGQVEFPLGAVTRSQIDVVGQWNAYADNPWVTFSLRYGTGAQYFSERCGTDAEPTFNALHFGPRVRKGSRITNIAVTLRSNSSELTALNIRVRFQYGPKGQSWTESNMHSDLIFTTDQFEIGIDKFENIDQQISEYTCPDDGFLLMFVKPVGSYTGTKYALMSASIGVESA